MKPFNLDQAHAGKPVVNGRGERAVDFHFFLDADYACCISVLFDGHAKPSLFSEGGIFYDEAGMSGDERNLYMTDTKRTVWAIVIKDDGGKFITMERLYESESSAQSAASVLRRTFSVIGVYPLEIEE